MDATEDKQVVLNLVLPGHTSEAFTGLYDKLKADDRNEYLAEGVFWMPGEAR